MVTLLVIVTRRVWSLPRIVSTLSLRVIFVIHKTDLKELLERVVLGEQLRSIPLVAVNHRSLNKMHFSFFLSYLFINLFFVL